MVAATFVSCACTLTYFVHANASASWLLSWKLTVSPCRAHLVLPDEKEWFFRMTVETFVPKCTSYFVKTVPCKKRSSENPRRSGTKMFFRFVCGGAAIVQDNRIKTDGKVPQGLGRLTTMLVGIGWWGLWCDCNDGCNVAEWSGG